MCADGLYEIVLSRQGSSFAPQGRALLLCRAGKLFGADPRGRLYRGRLRLYAKHDLRRGFINAVYETPPRLRVAPGTTKDMLSIVPISCEIDPCARSQSTTVLVGRKSIGVNITYLGPLAAVNVTRHQNRHENRR
jgi:hypothetical protein